MAGPGYGPQITDSPNEASKVPTPAPIRGGGDGLFQRWGDWLAKPENSAAMMQAGLELLQPRAAGQSVAGQFGQAIGAGGQARDEMIKTKQAEADALAEQAIKRSAVGVDAERNRLIAAGQPSEIDLRNAQADYYRKGGRAGVGGMTEYQRRRLRADLIKELGNVLDPDSPAGQLEIEKIQRDLAELDSGIAPAPAAGTPGLGAAVAPGDKTVPPPLAAMGLTLHDLEHSAKTGAWQIKGTNKRFDATGRPL
jgi:hypothetical protein